MIVRASLLSLAFLLAACSSQRPYDVLIVCLESVEELEELKSLASQMAANYELEVDDYSRSVSSDLKALDSPLATEDVLSLVLEDTRWRSETGLVMINNIGNPTPMAVTVSMFRNNALLGSDQNTDFFRRDFKFAASARWKVIDASSSDGSYDECSK